MASFTGRRHGLCDPRRGDDPVLHLLLDVRLPADRRPGLGARGCPRPRVHDGRDRRPDHPHTARASSTTTATATCSPRRSRSVRAYDPAYAYELAAVIRDGIERMYVHGEDVYYYVTLYNENYPMAPKPGDVDAGIVRGIYRFSAAPDGGRRRPRRAGPPRRQRRRSSSRSSRPSDPRPSGSTSRPRSTAPRRSSSSAATRSRSSAGTGSTRTSRPGSRTSPGPRTRRRSGRDRVGLAEGGARPRPAVAAAAATISLGHRGLRPERHPRGPPGPVRDRRRRASRRRALSGLARAGALRPEDGGQGHRALGIDPDKTDPLAL